MIQPKLYWRGVLSDIDQCLPICGVYILAYMGRILYVGKADDIPGRLNTHVNTGMLAIDYWLRSVGLCDPDNIRLDILESPDDSAWNAQAERACIKQYKPLFNTTYNTP